VAALLAGEYLCPRDAVAGTVTIDRWSAGLDQRPVELPTFAEAAPVLDDLAAVDESPSRRP
jgi:hypothetical protein